MKKPKSYGCWGKTVVGIFLFFALIYVYVSYMTYAKHRSIYLYYVADRYMPTQKRLTGRWPKDLSGLPNFFVSDAGGSGRGVSRFHQNFFKACEITRSDDVSCHFNLYIKGFWGFWPSPVGLEKCESVIRKK